jgi:hypothetical protein
MLLKKYRDVISTTQNGKIFLERYNNFSGNSDLNISLVKARLIQLNNYAMTCNKTSTLELGEEIMRNLTLVELYFVPFRVFILPGQDDVKEPEDTVNLIGNPLDMYPSYDDMIYGEIMSNVYLVRDNNNKPYTESGHSMYNFYATSDSHNVRGFHGIDKRYYMMACRMRQSSNLSVFNNTENTYGITRGGTVKHKKETQNKTVRLR